MKQEPNSSFYKGPLAFMAKNSVTANLLMFLFLIGGLIFSFQLKQEVFPEFELDYLAIQVPYPGASPEEVEEGIILAIEEELSSMDEIKHIYSNAYEGMASITVELGGHADNSKALQDVKSKIDRIASFPKNIEKPNISLAQPKKQVISLILYGDADENSLQQLGEKVRKDLLNYPEITVVDIANKKNREVEVSIPSKILREHQLSLQEVANKIQQESKELPLGSIKAPSGEILLKGGEKKKLSSQFLALPIVSSLEGPSLTLGDIATVVDTFEDSDEHSYYNHQNALRLDISRVSKQTPIEIADRVKEHVKLLNQSLPSHIKADTFNDASQIFAERIDLLVRNAFLGLVLVLILLGLFLDIRLAFWVTLGIPISIIGSFLFLPLTGASINMISLFAFIITLGIVVDDAVVVGEGIYQKREEGYKRLDAAILGIREVAMPVVFAVLTNIAAFLPLFFVPGITGKLFMQIPAVVVAVFLVSLIESLFILPSHLAHGKAKKRSPGSFSIREKTNNGLKLLIEKTYIPTLSFCLRYRLFTLLTGISLLVLAVFFISSGIISFTFLPKIDADIIKVSAQLPVGIPVEKTQQVAKQLEQALQEVLEKQSPKDIVQGIYTQIGRKGQSGRHGPSLYATRGSHLLSIQVLLKPSSERNISGLELSKAWRNSLGSLPNVKNLYFDATIGTSGGAALALNLSHENTESLESAALELATSLQLYQGVYDIDSGVSKGKSQWLFSPSKEGKSLGITSQYLSQEMRHYFYGAEALRLQRKRDEVKVMVRLPEQERASFQALEKLILFTPQKVEIPLTQVAEFTHQKAYESIKRVDYKRTIQVQADIDEQQNNGNIILNSMRKELLPSLEKKYPGLQFSLEGQQREQRESMEALKVGFLLTLFLIYSLLAIPFNSYVQPLIVIFSIPFGIVGALIGHVILGYSLSIISMFGIIALSGVVINDSLVLIVTCNRFKEDKQLSLKEAIIKGCCKRFRPIVLTSLTTFFGLAPMIFETSMQARFLIPMAISIGFGILFATFIILLIIPALYATVMQGFRAEKKS